MAKPTLPSILKTSQSRAVYARLLIELKKLGPFEADEKKTSIHIARGRAFAGVHPRASGIVLQIVTDAPIEHERVAKVEQVSKNRFHCTVRLESERDVDRQLMGWLKKAYALVA
jgi:hypothetical protein